MMKHPLSTLLAAALVVFIASGCVSGLNRSSATRTSNPDSPHELYTRYMEEARSQAALGDYPQAIQAYCLALTVEPGDQEAIKGRDAMEKAAEKKAKDLFDQGMKLRKQGKFKAARERFLAALRFSPDYPEPMAMLEVKDRIRAERIIVHTMQPGESVSSLAKTYYGSVDHFDVIALYNQMDDAAQVRVGQKITIPEVEGLPFNAAVAADTAPETEVGVSEMATHAAASSYQETPPEDAMDEPSMEQTDIYKTQAIQLFNQKEYSEAAFEFLKVLSSQPEDAEARHYLSRCYLEQGKTLMESDILSGARIQFGKALKANPDCSECVSLLAETDGRIKEWHYTRGVAFFEQEQPQEAIAEWRLVEAIDPAYKQVLSLIKRAETILKNLEAIKQSSTNTD